MVPASGAASRMFKNVFAFINDHGKLSKDDFMKTFFDNIGKFAFFPMLNNACVRLYGKSALTLMDEKRYEDVARALVEKEGLNYGKLPKALLQFHKIIGDSRSRNIWPKAPSTPPTRMAWCEYISPFPRTICPSSSSRWRKPPKYWLCSTA